MRTLRTESVHTRAIVEIPAGTPHARHPRENVGEIGLAPPSRRSLTKTAPPYAQWDKSGVRRVRIALQCQDEFYPAWKQNLETTFGFTQVSAAGKTRSYERTDVVFGKHTVFTVTLTEKDGDMFAPM